ncbi:MAG: hypothetical protein OXR72_18365 [Gemmatimonadota bacterium]|nr:hypothetical protein [Gemmatimonadota bacterium]
MLNNKGVTVRYSQEHRRWENLIAGKVAPISIYRTKREAQEEAERICFDLGLTLYVYTKAGSLFGKWDY